MSESVSFIEELDPEIFKLFCSEVMEYLKSIEENLLHLESGKHHKKYLHEIFRAIHTLKGSGGSILPEEVVKFLHTLEGEIKEYENKNVKPSSEFISFMLQCVDILESLIKALEDKKPVEKIVHQIKNLHQKFHSEDFSSHLEEKEEEITVEEEPISFKEEYIKVKSEKIEILINMIEELVITENMLKRNEDIEKIRKGDLDKILTQLSRITRTLQDVSLILRTVPINELFTRMQRVIRDTALRENKKIETKIIGGDTEIDRGIVEKLIDPMVHIVRNACSHGIESPSERKQKGKDEKGRVTLVSYYRGGNIIIEVIDDGRGIDYEKIREKAIEKGLISPEDKLSEKELIEFIFLPGFSTKDKASVSSGRGIGMDVVASVIKSLNGRIKIESEKDKGTKVSLILPLTLAIVDGILVQVGIEKFIIPTNLIKRSFRPSSDMIHKVKQKEFVKYNEKLYRIVKLGEIFELEGFIKEPEKSLLILVEGLDQDYCVQVDRILDKQEIVVKNPGKILEKFKYFNGAAILSDGTPHLILDTVILESFI